MAKGWWCGVRCGWVRRLRWCWRHGVLLAVLLAIEAGATGGVHDIIGVPVGESFACSSDTSDT